MLILQHQIQVCRDNVLARYIGIFQTKNILTNRNYSINLTDRNSSI